MSSTRHFPRFHLSRLPGRSHKSDKKGDKKKEQDNGNPHQSISIPIPLNSPLPGVPPSMQNRETAPKKKRYGTIQRNQISAPQLLSTTNNLAQNGFDLKTMGLTPEETAVSPRPSTTQSGSSEQSRNRSSDEDPSKDQLDSAKVSFESQSAQRDNQSQSPHHQLDHRNEGRQKLTVDTSPRPFQHPPPSSPLGLLPDVHSNSSASVTSSAEPSPSPTSTSMTSYSNAPESPFTSPEPKSNPKVNLIGPPKTQSHAPGSRPSSSKDTVSQSTQASGEHEKHVHPLSQVTSQEEADGETSLRTIAPPQLLYPQAPASPNPSNYDAETYRLDGVRKLSSQSGSQAVRIGNAIPPPSPQQEHHQHELTTPSPNGNPLHHHTNNDNDNDKTHYHQQQQQQQQPQHSNKVGPDDVDQQTIQRLGLLQFSAQDYIEELQDLLQSYLDGSSTRGFMKVQAF